MKKIIYSTIIATMSATMMFAQPVLATIPEIDLESMTTEELVTLRDSINEKIAENGGDNIIGSGIYEVGVDIKASNFKVIASRNYTGYTTFHIFMNRDEYDEYNSGNYDLGEIVELYGSEQLDYDIGILNLSEGEILYVSRGSAIIEEINSSWIPDDTDKKEADKEITEGSK